MKEIKLVLSLFIILLLIFSCAEDNNLDRLNSNNEDNIISTIFERTPNSTVATNNGIFPDVNKIEKVGKSTKLGRNLIGEINSIKVYDLDFAKIKRITLSSAKYYTYSIPFNSDGSKLIVLIKNNLISIVISKQVLLANGNKEFIVSNYKNNPLISLEKNKENKIGNRKIFKNIPSIFKCNMQFPKIESNFFAKEEESDCLGTGSFSKCMQCAWDECSSWVCGAALALEPEAIIGFAAAECGLDTLANNS